MVGFRQSSSLSLLITTPHTPPPTGVAASLPAGSAVYLGHIRGPPYGVARLSAHSSTLFPFIDPHVPANTTAGTLEKSAAVWLAESAPDPLISGSASFLTQQSALRGVQRWAGLPGRTPMLWDRGGGDSAYVLIEHEVLGGARPPNRNVTFDLYGRLAAPAPARLVEIHFPPRRLEKGVPPQLWINATPLRPVHNPCRGGCACC